jgi:hypothetical protein
MDCEFTPIFNEEKNTQTLYRHNNLTLIDTNLSWFHSVFSIIEAIDNELRKFTHDTFHGRREVDLQNYSSLYTLFEGI